jgi:hypothetical protein
MFSVRSGRTKFAKENRYVFGVQARTFGRERQVVDVGPDNRRADQHGRVGVNETVCLTATLPRFLFAGYRY